MNTKEELNAVNTAGDETETTNGQPDELTESELEQAGGGSASKCERCSYRGSGSCKERLKLGLCVELLG